jgi:hypothetical protein
MYVHPASASSRAEALDGSRGYAVRSTKAMPAAAYGKSDHVAQDTLAPRHYFSTLTSTDGRITRIWSLPALGPPHLNLDGRYRTTNRPPVTGLRRLRIN